jgi:hypothetical protein
MAFSMLKVGVIGRADPTGLGTLTVEFCHGMHGYISKALILERDSRGATDTSNIHPDIDVEVVKEITNEKLEEFLPSLDAVVGFETFYNHDIFSIAHRQGVKTVVFPMWECSPVNVGAADFVFNLSDTDQHWFPWGVRCDWPIDDWELAPREVKVPPQRIVCNAGSLGLNNRNNVDAVKKAFLLGALSGTGCELLIRSHHHECTSFLETPHGRMIEAAGPARTREEIYDGADVIIHFQAHDGLALPLVEAAQCRIPTLVLDIEGYKHYPDSMRINCPTSTLHKIGDREIRYWRPSVEHLAEVMNGLATGKIFPALPPRPATWGEFENIWLETLEKAVA